MQELEKAKTDLNDDEIERAKNKIASSLVLSGEVPLGRMRSIGGQWIYNKEYRSLEQDMATLMGVEPRIAPAAHEGFPVRPDDDRLARPAPAGRNQELIRPCKPRPPNLRPCSITRRSRRRTRSCVAGCAVTTVVVCIVAGR